MSTVRERRLVCIAASAVALAVSAFPVCAQDLDPSADVAAATSGVVFASFTPDDFAAFSSPAPRAASTRGRAREIRHVTQTGEAFAVSDAWRETSSGVVERLRIERSGDLVRADGAPVPVRAGEAARLDTRDYEMNYSRGWRSRPIRAGGAQIDVTPHVGIGVGSDGGSASAGATVRIGDRLDSLAPEGREAFGDTGRWYLFAAGEGRAVGYNFARNRDGDFVRSGLSQDRGSFMGDAQVGVAWRRGDVQTSFGYVYREHKARELRGGKDFDRDASEGVIALQLSIRPDW